MEPFMYRTLKKLRKESPRRFKELRQLCDDLTAYMDKDSEVHVEVDKFFEPLELACESRHPKIMEIALDALHFLIEHGFLRETKKIDSMNMLLDESEIESSFDDRSLMDLVIETVSKCSDEYDDGVQLQVIKVLLTAITSLHCQVHEASLLLSIRACFHIHLISKNPVNKLTAKAALTQMLNVIYQRMELNDSAESLPEVDDVAKETKTSSAFPSVYHKDAYLLFRALCKLSMKNSSEEYAQNDSIALQNKLLSLELILSIFQGSGKAFQTSEKFIAAIKSYLCVSLLGNCTSHVAEVVGLSLQIFTLLMNHFREHLKSELEVFVSTIFLRILESENSTYDHKLRVLEVFHSICKEPRSVVEIFMNYDCDLDAINLFSRIVDGFAKIAKNPLSASQSSGLEFLASSRKLQLEEHTLRSKGLEGLDIVLRSLIDILKVSSTDQDFTDEEKYPEEFQSLETVNSYISNTLCESATNVDNISPPSNLDNSKVAVETFDRKQKMQEEIEVGILKFNLSPKKGLQYLVSSGHLVLEPNRIAEFLHFHQERLDKTAVGDFLGREREYENGLCLSVLHEYVEQMNFENMPFDMAIRHFLSGFRLPGEAQKIDRIMEKFAERYYLQNSDVFASADMAFILAFSTIMLQTNLHNPAIRDDKRMTKEQFIKQNKGITADGELPDQLLSEIYDRISSQPISINQDEKFRKSKKDEHTSFVVFQATNDRKKKDAFNSERLEMVKAGEAMFRQASKRGSTFLRNTGENGVIENKYVKPMYEITWPPVIGVISYVIESLDDNTLIMSAISIFQKSIALAGRLDISVARNTFINTLAKFTTLDTIREMHEKNILCIRLLIELALTEGNYLEESWTQILLVLSQLSRLQLFATGSHSDAIFFSDSYAESSAKISGKRPLLFNTSVERHSSSRQSTSFSDPISKLFLGPSKAETARLVEEANADLVTKGIDSYQIDRIFLNSATLNATSVKFLVDSLCEVSLLEISGGTTNGNRLKDITHESAPRVFSLQKLVEVADCNMHIRSRLDWSRIWSLLAKHFSTVGIHENIALAMYAIDSLKQLSIKFLQKEELSNFNFQRLFLKPFEVIISNTKCHEIKDLVLRCIEIMIRSCATNIRSGWKTIFLILEVSAEHDEFETAALAYTILNTQMQDNFQLLVHDFVELLNCVVSFTASVHTKLSIQALDSIALCAEKLATGSIVFSSVASPNVVDQQLESLEKMHSLEVGEDSSVFKLWWPLLLGLSTRISDCRFQVRDKALKTLKFVLFQYGSSFSSQIWSVIFRGILFPIVDSARTDTSNQPKARWPTEIIENFVDENSWICSTLLNVLEFFRDLYFHVHLKDEHHGLLRELFKLLVGLICRETENIGKISISVFFSMITCLRDIHEEHQYEKEVGKMISHSICECLLANLCIHFNSLGSISLEGVVSVEKLDDISFCSILSSRFFDGASDTGSDCVPLITDISTDYGEGKLLQILAPDTIKNIPARQMIRLNWGMLYSAYVSQDSLKRIRLHDFPDNLMTSSVLAFDLLVKTNDLLKVDSDFWRESDYACVLNSVEAVHWHAYLFNKEYSIRSRLSQIGFMANRPVSSGYTLPHLLEQEILSIEIVVAIVYRFYGHSPSCQIYDNHFDNTLKRYSLLVIDRYLFLEENKRESVDDNELVDAIDSYYRLEHKAYRAPLLMVLNGLLSTSSAKFHTHSCWLLPSLARLIICYDFEVRTKVKAIYNHHINPYFGTVIDSPKAGTAN